MLERRDFLCDLAALPLVGGGLNLIGAPTAAAVPVTDALATRYLAWLAREHWAAQCEHEWRGAVAAWHPDPDSLDPSAEAYAARCVSRSLGPTWWMPEGADLDTIVGAAPASSRAAVILSAAGIPLVGVAA